MQPSIDLSKEVAKLHSRDKQTTIVDIMQKRRQGAIALWESNSRWEESSRANQSRDDTALDW